jgi:hypothetical protein
MRADMMAQLGAEAGFARVDRLDEPELDMLRFYRFTP